MLLNADNGIFVLYNIKMLLYSEINNFLGLIFKKYFCTNDYR
ncbi:hypothetical protein Q7M_1292 (plasmid) [Borrelia crocidurae str. Achema]|uniref:Uncharacterized protein n=1 Tax=Borrelia crocidurae (strain Achema) TaxID=1155096 RepID=I0FEZ2_BORCA|nr:hypothetical protein Q7M_1292 [Borrelia crocidurae str. Achema]